MAFASQGFFGFAAEHEGRFPNKAQSSIEHWPATWQQILNREYYHGNAPSFYPTSAYGDEPTCGPLVRFWSFWNPPYYINSWLTTKYATCPAYTAWGTPPGTSNIWTRAWIMNRYASGGVDWTPAPWEGQYGKLLANPQAVNPAYSAYALGTRLDLFANPSGKFVIWECESGSDVNTGGTSSGGKVILGGDPTRPPWTGLNGTWAFRHNLPTAVSGYQQEARSLILYVDGQVRRTAPNDSILVTSHFQPTP
jgi:hypothetical protein